MLPTLATQHLPHPASAAAPPTPKDQTLITRNPSLNCRCFLFLSIWLPPTYIRTYDEHRTSAINTATQSSNSRTETAISALVQAFFQSTKRKEKCEHGDGTWSRGLTSFPFPRGTRRREKAYFTYSSVLACVWRRVAAIRVRSNLPSMRRRNKLRGNKVFYRFQMDAGYTAGLSRNNSISPINWCTPQHCSVYR
jgi:hypothetical protein